MTSLNGNDGEPARKRARLSPSEDDLPENETPVFIKSAEDGLSTQPISEMLPEIKTSSVHTSSKVMDREARIGILNFVSDNNTGFTGVLKQRYTDFLVNEIKPDGTVVHLTDTRAPRRPVLKYESEQPNGQPPQHTEVSELNTQSPSATDDVVIGDHDGTALSVKADMRAEEKPQLSTTGSVINVSTSGSKNSSDVEVQAEDVAMLDSFFGEELRDRLLQLYGKILRNPEAKPFTFGSLHSAPIHDRQLRTSIHQNIRRIFKSRLETSMDETGAIKIVAAVRSRPQGHFGKESKDKRGTPKGKLGWSELGGEHLHFSLYKENKDTMEIIPQIGFRLKIPAKHFCYAGTKDRRAVTVQRVSVFRTHAEKVASVNSAIKNASVGNFSYEKHGLELGELAGNEFQITLRDCDFPAFDLLSDEERVTNARQVVERSVENIRRHGFINYYGSQRFGTHAVGTDIVGLKCLQGDFEGAVQAILSYNADLLSSSSSNTSSEQQFGTPQDDISRAMAIKLFQDGGNGHEAAKLLPRKFGAEAAMLRYLHSKSSDYAGALMQINRHLRLMYVHAYQSLVWNLVVSERWKRYGATVIAGDLVIVDATNAKSDALQTGEETDENGEVIVRPAVEDMAVTHDDLFERARPLSAQEAESGKYSIFDIVLPTPGYDVEYPTNDIGDYYQEIMQSERGGGLHPGDMRRKQKDFSLSGSYRKVLATVGEDITSEVRLYSDDTEQMVDTDVDMMKKLRPGHSADVGEPVQLRQQKHGNARQQSKRGRDEGASGDQAKDLMTLSPKAIANPWLNSSAQVRADDAALADSIRAEKATAFTGSDPQTSRAPVFNETFIETNGQDGSRTGRREQVTRASQGALIESAISAEKLASPKDEADFKMSNANPVSGDTLPGVFPTSELNLKPKVRTWVQEQGDGENAKHAASDILRPSKTASKAAAKKIAVILKFQLGTSQYATVALRELMHGGTKTYRPEFSMDSR